MTFGLSAAAWGGIASAGVGLLTSQQGKKGSSSTTQQQMDPAMRPYIFGGEGQKGLLQYNQGQLARSQAPERMQGWANMMNRGQQLMGGSVAGNPFASGYQGGGLFQGAGGNGLGQYTPQPIPMPAPQQPAPALTLDEIMAEIERRQREAAAGAGSYDQAGGGGPGNGGGDGGGPGPGGSW